MLKARSLGSIEGTSEEKQAPFPSKILACSIIRSFVHLERWTSFMNHQETDKC